MFYYPFIVLSLLLLALITIPPFLAACIDMKKRESNKDDRKEDENG